jgi:hypothetical protein
MASEVSRFAAEREECCTESSQTVQEKDNPRKLSVAVGEFSSGERRYMPSGSGRIPSSALPSLGMHICRPPPSFLNPFLTTKLG